MGRFTVALMALACLTAFAPAPLPKTGREDRKPGVRLSEIQGTWEVAGFGFLKPNGKQEKASWIKAVRIKGDLLTFVTNEGDDKLSYRIAIDHSRKPTWIDFYYTKDPVGSGPAMHGVIRRQGSQMEFLYSGPPKAVGRPSGFEKPGFCARVALRRGGTDSMK